MATPKKKPARDFVVTIDMKYSHEVRVKATTPAEARNKAAEKLIKKLKPSDFHRWETEL